MYNGLLHFHSLLRYFVLILLLAVIIQAIVGLMNKRPFSKANDKLSLWLLILTHIQMLVGLFLYFKSPWVQFGGDTMKNDTLRYWTVEHIFGMLVAVVLITVARVTSKRLVTDQAKHKRLLILNTVALLIIVTTVLLSDRSLFVMSAMQR